ncbi:MAG: XdhC family protein [Acidobacteriaceae bacterium]|nr:XdhC family protein [Acidobacteriaceae bacterium]
MNLWQQRGTQPAVLVTLTSTSGSSYRRPGAHVLLFEDGRHAGTISGGCLEAEVARKAFWMTRDGAAMHRYSTLFDDTAEIPFGLGCGGQIDILLEPAATPECAALFAALQSSLAGQPSTAVTLLLADGQPLQRVIYAKDGTILFASPALSAEEIKSLVILTLSEAKGKDLDADATTIAPVANREIYIEHLLPPQRLVIFGAGDDAQPLATLAAQIGWSITIADGRAQFAQAARFPTADTVLLLAEDLSIAPIAVAKDDAVVLMTHSYAQDRALLTQLLPVAPRYLAVLGARHRTSILVSEVAATLGWSMEECAALLHAPVGLNLGGDAPESIALAILAEAHAHCAGRDARPRRITAAQMWQHLESAVRTSSPPLVCSMDSPFAAAIDPPKGK